MAALWVSVSSYSIGLTLEVQYDVLDMKDMSLSRKQDCSGSKDKENKKCYHYGWLWCPDCIKNKKFGSQLKA